MLASRAWVLRSDCVTLRRSSNTCAMRLRRACTCCRTLLSIEVPLTLNEAFCEHHRKRCPSSDELNRECGKVRRAAAAPSWQLQHTARP